MSNTELGKIGETYVLSKLLSLGYKIPQKILSEDEFKGVDLIVEDINGDFIQIQVKTSSNNLYCSANSKAFDYLIFTNLKDCWILKIDILKNRNLGNLKITKKFEIFKNRWDILKMSEYHFVEHLIDHQSQSMLQ